MLTSGRMPAPDDWLEKLPARRGDPDRIVADRIEQTNQLRRREHLIRVATRTLRTARLLPPDEAAATLAAVAEMRREAANVPKEKPSE